MHVHCLCSFLLGCCARDETSGSSGIGLGDDAGDLTEHDD